ncbi:two-component system sensor histidine kinase NtrB [Jeotgalibacillus aurantiacus]|uniref:two-component system sensor histidine kinase NtrB n=1 Tax=Jeotgalibacillus aurantiacus TaxID=2763266 RepID=UPI001D0AFE45|nr:ATP-binding protein [Jeotgalibacillus aurantiacus]
MSEEQFITERNKRMLFILWIAYGLQVLSFFIVDQRIEQSLQPHGFIIISFTTALVLLIKQPVIGMWIVLGGLYLYILYFNLNYPLLVNILFFFFGILASSFYLNRKVLMISSSLSSVLISYFFLTHFNEISESFRRADLLYLLLFLILLTTFLLIYTSYIQQIHKRLKQEETQAKKELTSKKGYQNLLFEHAQDAIIVYNLEEIIVEVNPAFEKIYGWAKEEAIGKRLPIVPKERLEEASDRTQRMMQGESFSTFRTKDQRRDGSLVDVEITLSPIFDDDDQVIAMSAIIRDVSYKVETEKYMIQSEKLSLAGEIAAGVTHEIRNPLTVISGFLQMMNEDSNNPYPTYTKVMEAEIQRINLIISEFLVLAKPQADIYKQVSLEELISTTLTLFETELHLKNIQVEQTWDTSPVFLHGDENQLKQVLLNIFKNAADAMPAGGYIKIEVLQAIYRQHPAIEISITDTGTGMEPEVLQKIKDPFFTTKENGTGLGFVISDRIIHSHGGEIRVKSKVNHGTTIKIVLPLSGD